MIRVGIIGLGFMGRTHYEAYGKTGLATVVAISDADPKRAGGDLSGGWANLDQGKVDQLPMDGIRGTTDWRELLSWPEVEVVDVCLPTPAHVEIVSAALAAGKHVICEKPLARTSAEARRIADAAAGATGLFMPAMCMRFWPEWEWLKRAVDGGHYGHVRAATFRRVGPMPQGWFRNGAISGGALLDLHIHDTDFIYHLFGKPAGVYSRGYKGGSGEIDHLVTQYLFDPPAAGLTTTTTAPPPALVVAEGSWTVSDGYGFSMRYTVVFERATADYDSSRKDRLLLLAAAGKSEPVAVGTDDGYQGELTYFLECVKSGQPPQRVTAEDAVVGLQIAEAEGRSVASGRVEAIG